MQPTANHDKWWTQSRRCTSNLLKRLHAVCICVFCLKQLVRVVLSSMKQCHRVNLFTNMSHAVPRLLVETDNLYPSFRNFQDSFMHNQHFFLNYLNWRTYFTARNMYIADY